MKKLGAICYRAYFEKFKEGERAQTLNYTLSIFHSVTFQILSNFPTFLLSECRDIATPPVLVCRLAVSMSTYKPQKSSASRII